MEEILKEKEMYQITEGRKYRSDAAVGIQYKHWSTNGIETSKYTSIWVFPKIGVPQNGWFIMENPIKMDGLEVPPF